MKIRIIKFFLFSLLICFNLSYAENTEVAIEEAVDEIEIIEPNVDCLILDDENSIICKFERTRQIEDENITVQWIDPLGEISRSRDILISAGHGSIYDYRYVDGRETGIWTFKVITKDKEYSTKFELK